MNHLDAQMKDDNQYWSQLSSTLQNMRKYGQYLDTNIANFENFFSID